MRAKQTQVKDVMTFPTVRIRQDSHLHHAAEVVALSGVSDLMVVDDDDNLVGVSSSTTL